MVKQTLQLHTMLHFLMVEFNSFLYISKELTGLTANILSCYPNNTPGRNDRKSCSVCNNLFPKDMCKIDKDMYIGVFVYLNVYAIIPTLFPDYWCFAIPELSISVMHFLVVGAHACVEDYH